MPKRDLENLAKRYNSASAQRALMKGPGGRRGPGARGSGSKPKNTKETISRLFKYISAYKLRMAVVFVFMLLRTLAALAGSYMLRPIINNYIAVGKLEGFFMALMVLLGVYLVNIGCTYM